MGSRELGTVRICACTSTKKTAEKILHLTLTLDSHALSIRAVMALLRRLV